MQENNSQNAEAQLHQTFDLVKKGDLKITFAHKNSIPVKEVSPVLTTINNDDDLLEAVSPQQNGRAVSFDLDLRALTFERFQKLLKLQNQVSITTEPFVDEFGKTHQQKIGLFYFEASDAIVDEASKLNDKFTPLKEKYVLLRSKDPQALKDAILRNQTELQRLAREAKYEELKTLADDTRLLEVELADVTSGQHKKDLDKVMRDLEELFEYRGRDIKREEEKDQDALTAKATPELITKNKPGEKLDLITQQISETEIEEPTVDFINTGNAIEVLARIEAACIKKTITPELVAAVFQRFGISIVDEADNFNWEIVLENIIPNIEKFRRGPLIEAKVLSLQQIPRLPKDAIDREQLDRLRELIPGAKDSLVTLRESPQMAVEIERRLKSGASDMRARFPGEKLAQMSEILEDNSPNYRAVADGGDVLNVDRTFDALSDAYYSLSPNERAKLRKFWLLVNKHEGAVYGIQNPNLKWTQLPIRQNWFQDSLKGHLFDARTGLFDLLVLIKTKGIVAPTKGDSDYESDGLQQNSKHFFDNIKSCFEPKVNEDVKGQLPVRLVDIEPAFQDFYDLIKREQGEKKDYLEAIKNACSKMEPDAILRMQSVIRAFDYLVDTDLVEFRADAVTTRDKLIKFKTISQHLASRFARTYRGNRDKIPVPVMFEGELEATPGTVTTIIGANGAGKTSFAESLTDPIESIGMDVNGDLNVDRANSTLQFPHAQKDSRAFLVLDALGQGSTFQKMVRLDLMTALVKGWRDETFGTAAIPALALDICDALVGDVSRLTTHQPINLHQLVREIIGQRDYEQRMRAALVQEKGGRRVVTPNNTIAFSGGASMLRNFVSAPELLTDTLREAEIREVYTNFTKEMLYFGKKVGQQIESKMSKGEITRARSEDLEALGLGRGGIAAKEIARLFFGVAHRSKGLTAERFAAKSGNVQELLQQVVNLWLSRPDELPERKKLMETFLVGRPWWAGAIRELGLDSVIRFVNEKRFLQIMDVAEQPLKDVVEKFGVIAVLPDLLKGSEHSIINVLHNVKGTQMPNLKEFIQKLKRTGFFKNPETLEYLNSVEKLLRTIYNFRNRSISQDVSEETQVAMLASARSKFPDVFTGLSENDLYTIEKPDQREAFNEIASKDQELERVDSDMDKLTQQYNNLEQKQVGEAVANVFADWTGEELAELNSVFGKMRKKSGLDDLKIEERLKGLFDEAEIEKVKADYLYTNPDLTRLYYFLTRYAGKEVLGSVIGGTYVTDNPRYEEFKWKIDDFFERQHREIRPDQFDRDIDAFKLKVSREKAAAAIGKILGLLNYRLVVKAGHKTDNNPLVHFGCFRAYFAAPMNNFGMILRQTENVSGQLEEARKRKERVILDIKGNEISFNSRHGYERESANYVYFQKLRDLYTCLKILKPRDRIEERKQKLDVQKVIDTYKDLRSSPYFKKNQILEFYADVIDGQSNPKEVLYSWLSSITGERVEEIKKRSPIDWADWYEKNKDKNYVDSGLKDMVEVLITRTAQEQLLRALPQINVDQIKNIEDELHQATVMLARACQFIEVGRWSEAVIGGKGISVKNAMNQQVAGDIGQKLDREAGKSEWADPRSRFARAVGRTVPITANIDSGTTLITAPHGGKKTCTRDGLINTAIDALTLGYGMADAIRVEPFDAFRLVKPAATGTDLSAYTAHIKSGAQVMSEIIAMAKLGMSCMVGLDEAGIGTNPTEGAAFAAGILNTLRRVPNNTVIAICPEPKVVNQARGKGDALVTINQNGLVVPVEQAVDLAPEEALKKIGFPEQYISLYKAVEEMLIELEAKGQLKVDLSAVN